MLWQKQKVQETSYISEDFFGPLLLGRLFGREVQHAWVRRRRRN